MENLVTKMLEKKIKTCEGRIRRARAALKKDYGQYETDKGWEDLKNACKAYYDDNVVKGGNIKDYHPTFEDYYNFNCKAVKNDIEILNNKIKTNQDEIKQYQDAYDILKKA